MPQAPVAANIASAETDCQTAAGPSTRNGAARRASCSAPSTRAVTSTATAVVAARTVTTRPAANPLPSCSRSSSHEERQRPGRVAGDVHRPVARLRLVADPADVLLQGRVQVRRTTGGAEVLVGVAEDLAHAVRAVDERQRQHPGQPADEHHEQQPPPGQPLGQPERRAAGRARRARRAGSGAPAQRAGPTRRAAAGTSSPARSSRSRRAPPSPAPSAPRRPPGPTRPRCRRRVRRPGSVVVIRRG